MTTDNRARVVLATRNPGKRKELEALLSDLPLEIFALDEFQNCPEIVEDGRTFQENATKKALAIAKFTGMMAIGEDSG
ncbi:MAG: non-canonical purine NTP pyrophosphatase, partial [Planctomycetes bacterium]|nr:non-canonical purine NTP pyrophosphatase [Planctomycetota bacterium]